MIAQSNCSLSLKQILTSCDSLNSTQILHSRSPWGIGQQRVLSTHHTAVCVVRHGNNQEKRQKKIRLKKLSVSLYSRVKGEIENVCTTEFLRVKSILYPHYISGSLIRSFELYLTLHYTSTPYAVHRQRIRHHYNILHYTT